STINRRNAAMPLTRIVYCSELTENIGSDEIADILQVSRENNAKQAVSGVLLFNTHYFLQCLEGSRAAVNGIYCRICCDQRHHNAQLLTYGEVSQRLFSAWSMAYVPWTEATRTRIAQYSIGTEFNPYQMSAESVVKLLEELGRLLLKDAG
ncbi:MAG: BLUF domain-containing protein, partial [Halochromatium sp.]